MDLKVVTRAAGRGLLLLKKYAPEIMVASGVGVLITGGIMAAKATLQLEENLEEPRRLISGHKKLRAERSVVDYPQETFRRDMVISWREYVVALTKTYAVPVGVGLLGVGLIFAGHGLLRYRNLALMAAYETLDHAFKKYRERVVEDQGEEKDREYAQGRKRVVVDVDPETGEKTVTEVDVVDAASQYAVIFDEMNINHTKGNEQNIFFLRMQEKYATNTLRSRGHIFLNEVYDMVGVTRTPAGAVVGWLYKNPGDSVDFGINEIRAQSYMDNRDPAILLDFDVDGVIYNKI